MQMSTITWRDLTTVPPLPEMCRLLNRIFGVDMAIVSPDGREGVHMTPRSERPPFCSLLQKHPAGRRLCLDCDSLHVTQASRTHVPMRYHCHAGLSEFLVPIVIEGEVVAHLNCGRIRDHNPKALDRRRLVRKFASLALDERELWKEYRQVRMIPDDIQEGLLTLLSLLAQHAAVTHVRILSMEQPPRKRIVSQSQSFMRSRFRETLRIREIAAKAGTSKRNLERFFRLETGGSVSAYLRRLRIDHACAQLRDTEARIAEIAMNSGFGSVQQFNRTFKTVIGHTPRAWRRQARKPTP